jgi:hypothetical protein
MVAEGQVPPNEPASDTLEEFSNPHDFLALPACL